LYSVLERFEDVYASAGCVTAFFIFLALICAAFLKNIYVNYWGSQSIYTYLTLPVKREMIYFSKLCAFMICLLLFLATQLLTVQLGYSLVAAKLGSLNNGEFVMTNGLFLAFIRSGFLRMLLPLNVNGVLSSMSILLGLATGLYYAALIERSKRYWGYMIVAVAVIIIMKEWDFRMSLPVYNVTFTEYYLKPIVLLCLSSFFIWHGSRLIKKGAVA
ncbi:MAG: hypothetical protein K6T85_08235, partial [Gorillibacterium sp.]|nr:hypothetical protein [Gorillibacterium sp.]